MYYIKKSVKYDSNKLGLEAALDKAGTYFVVWIKISL